MYTILSINKKWILFSIILAIVLAKVITIPFTKAKVKVVQERMILLYRGIPEDHPMFSLACRGIIKPLGTHTSIIRHRNGDTRSRFNSWTSKLPVAVSYAKYDRNGVPCNGVVAIKAFSTSELIELGVRDVFNEDEYLTIDEVIGATVIPISHNETKETLEWKLRN